MESDKRFIVPEYYPDFKCKASECRNPCCEGWKVSISMADYFRLVGLKCGKKLRAKIDCALIIKERGDRESYAELSRGPDGRCKLHRADGLCAVQAELGEECLPAVCRYYPRAIRNSYVDECFCSNSCEAVVEALARLPEPLKFIEARFSSGETPRRMDIDAAEYAVQRKCADIMQDRSVALPERLRSLCDFLCGTTGAERRGKDIAGTLRVMHAFANWFENESESLRGYCIEAQNFYGTEGRDELSDEELSRAVQRYEEGRRAFDRAFPDGQRLFEQVLVNHMFYEGFPYSEKQKNPSASFASLAAIYAFLRYNAIGCLAEKPAQDKLVDVIAAMFRLIEHSEFDKNARVILKSLGCDGPEKQKQLVSI